MATYEQTDEESLFAAVDEFLASLPQKVMSEKEFDRLFDHTRDALLRIGTFNEGRRNGADFVSSRYVDQIPLIGVSVREDFPCEMLIQAATMAHTNAPSPYGILFDLYPDYIASLPERLIGTLKLSEYP